MQQTLKWQNIVNLTEKSFGCGFVAPALFSNKEWLHFSPFSPSFSTNYLLIMIYNGIFLLKLANSNLPNFAHNSFNRDLKFEPNNYYLQYLSVCFFNKICLESTFIWNLSPSFFCVVCCKIYSHINWASRVLLCLNKSRQFE